MLVRPGFRAPGARCDTVAVRRPRAGPELPAGGECRRCRALIGDKVRIQGMSQQPELSSPPMPANPAPKPEPVPQRIPRWLERGELFLRVLLRMYIGLAVCYVPWSRMFWDLNPIFLHFPTLGRFAMYGAVRGVISGLGLLNLWIAFDDAIRHRDG